MGYFTTKGRGGTTLAMMFQSTFWTILFITLFPPKRFPGGIDDTKRMVQTERHIGFGYQLGVTGHR